MWTGAAGCRFRTCIISIFLTAVVEVLRVAALDDLGGHHHGRDCLHREDALQARGLLRPDRGGHNDLVSLISTHYISTYNVSTHDPSIYNIYTLPQYL